MFVGGPLGIQRAICAGFAAVLLFAGYASLAADYRPDDFLTMDLSKAALSPKPLGPPSEFAPIPVEAKSEPSGVLPHADARKVAVTNVKAAPERAELSPAARREIRVSRASPERRRGAARERLAHRHGNPLDAQAMDPRIRKWPCKSGDSGICGWKQ
jgi:hypothetical protein